MPDALGTRGRDGPNYEIRSETPTRLLHELTEWALAEGVELSALQVARPSLEDVYLKLTDAAEAA